MNNVFSNVQNCKLKYEITGVGELYVCHIESDAWSTAYSGFKKINLATQFDTSKLLNVSIVGNKIKILPKKDASFFWLDYNESIKEREDDCCIMVAEGAYVYHWTDAEIEFNESLGIRYSAEHKEAIRFNRTAYFSKYFNVKITDEVTGITTTIKLDVRDLRVDLNNSDMSF